MGVWLVLAAFQPPARIPPTTGSAWVGPRGPTIRAGFESRGKLLGPKGSFIKYFKSKGARLRAGEGQGALRATGSGSTLEEATRIVDGLRSLFFKPDPLPSRERFQAVAPNTLLPSKADRAET